MKKLVQVFLILTLFFLGKELKAQYIFKVGPSLMYSFDNGELDLVVSYGLNPGFEVALGKKSSLVIGTNLHYRKQESTDTEGLIVKYRFAGFKFEYRRNFRGVFNSPYIGIFGELQSWKKRFSFPSRIDLQGQDVNFGISFGYTGRIDTDNLNFKVKNKKYVNPYLYVGFNPTGANEFPVNIRLGVDIGF